MGQHCFVLGPMAMTVDCVTLNEGLRGEPTRPGKLEISNLVDSSLKLITTYRVDYVEIGSW